MPLKLLDFIPFPRGSVNRGVAVVTRYLKQLDSLTVTVNSENEKSKEK